MAFETFISEVEAKKLLKERDKHLIFADHCTREYDGEVNELGDQIRIKGLGVPSVYQLQKDGTYTANAVGTGSAASGAGKGKDVIHNGIPEAEDIAGNEVKLTVNQIATWNIQIGDIDKELSKQGKGVFAKYKVKIAKKLANLQDQYIAKVITSFKNSENADTTEYTKGTGIYLSSGDGGSTTINGSSVITHNILDFVDAQVQLFNERDYSDDEVLYAEVTPKFWRYLKKALRKIDTDNSKIVRGRACVEYNGIEFYKTNNALIDTTEYMVLRTKDAVAFFDPLLHNEPYRKEKGFADCWKGFSLYDSGIVEPKGVLWSKVLGYANN